MTTPTSRDKVLSTMYELMHKLGDDWTEHLDQLNIDNEYVEKMYADPDIKGDALRGNIVLCYTVLAYDNRSRFLEPHKDRWENKKKILVKLGGLSVMTIPFFQQLIGNQHTACFDLASWYIGYQRDWRWGQWITLTEFHSMSENMAKKGALDATEAVQIGKMLEIAEKRRMRADEILDDLKKEFLHLDTALEKEDRLTITDVDNSNFMSYEIFLDQKNKALAAASD